MTRIVAGVDGSTSAVNAVVWAAAEAARHRDSVRLVHAYFVPAHGYPRFAATASTLREGLRFQGEEMVREAREAVEKVVPEVDVQTELVEGDPAGVLLGESRQARMVVLGSRGLGGFTGKLLGSVAIALAAHGRCPVVVVRGKRLTDPPPVEGPVVVGVDGSDTSTAAVTFAFEQASRWGAPLIAVHTWSDLTLDTTVRMYPLSIDPADVDADEKRALEEQLAACRERYPRVAVEPMVARGRPVRTLLEFGERARLLVVGSRGRGGFKGMLLGSTSHALVVHSPCPVAVVRPPDVDGQR